MADVGAMMEVGMSDAEAENSDQDFSDYDANYYHDDMYDNDSSQLAVLRRNCTSDDVLQRQLAAKSINYTAKSLQLESEFQMLLQIVNHLSNDAETGVCIELMERLPELCLILLESGVVPMAIPNYILPIIVKYLGDRNNDIRRLAHNGLLKLVDNNIIGRDDVERHVTDVLLQLVEAGNSEEFRTEAVAMMTKLAPYLGKDITLRVFYKPFKELCSDDAFLIRKMCATNFTDIASVVDFDTAEKLFLPLFSQLCLDVVWGVRKACAESFPSLASCFSREVRFQSLSPLFVNFFDDTSRWVQVAAYQSLGQFISTFSDPSRSGFELSIDGVLVPWNGPVDIDDTCEAEKLTESNEMTPAETNAEQEDEAVKDDKEKPVDITMQDSTAAQENSQIEDKEKKSTDEAISNSQSKYEKEEITSESADDVSLNDIPTDFNSFVYWKTPIPDLDLSDDPLVNAKDTEHKPHNADDEDEDDDDEEDDDVEQCRRQIPQLSITKPGGYTGTETYQNTFRSSLWPFCVDESLDQDDVDLYSNDRHSFSEDLPDLIQDVLPTQILFHYISMTRSTKASMIDTDIALHCAYTMPGVVLTLGRKNWHCLKETYETLAQNMQWKIRRTLAYSIHHLALILGDDITVSDLSPVFNAFVKDLDEVRIGVLKHLYEFVSLLPVEIQKSYLPMFKDFSKSDNSRNWRFRQELGRQLILLSRLYNIEEINEYFIPIALHLAIDQVAEVRMIAFKVLSVILGALRDSNQPSFVRKFVAEIIGLCTFHQSWVKRKSCAHACLTFLQHNVEKPQMFAEDFLPGLLTLASDPVPNVRLIAAKALVKFVNSDFFHSLPEDNETRILVETHMRQLQADDDRDVRYFSGGNRNPVGSNSCNLEKSLGSASSQYSSSGQDINTSRNLVVVVQESSRHNTPLSVSSSGHQSMSNDSGKDSSANSFVQSAPPSIQVVGSSHRSLTVRNEPNDYTVTRDETLSADGKSIVVEEVIETYGPSSDDDCDPLPGEEVVVEEVVEEIVEEYEET